MINRKVKINYNILLKLALITFFKNYLNIFFSFVVPFIWLIVCYYTWGNFKITTSNHQTFKLFRFIFSSVSLTPVLSLGLMTIPYTFGFSKIGGRYKNYATMGVKPIQYLSAYFIVSFSVYFVLENCLLLISNFGFLKDELISSLQYFCVWLINLYIFISLFLVATSLSLIPKTERTLVMMVQIYFMFNLILSGVSVPSISFNPNMYNSSTNQADNWFKFIQYLTPVGCACRIGQNIMTPYFWNWETDWLSIFMPLLFSSLSIWFIHKNFSWVKR